MSKSLEQRVHDEARDTLCDRLRAKGKYDFVRTEVPFYYSNGQLAGKMDVCAYLRDRRTNWNYIYYFEVKMGYNTKEAHRDANGQNYHFKKATSGMVHTKTQFIYVGRDTIKRIK